MFQNEEQIDSITGQPLPKDKVILEQIRIKKQIEELNF